MEEGVGKKEYLEGMSGKAEESVADAGKGIMEPKNSSEESAVAERDGTGESTMAEKEEAIEGTAAGKKGSAESREVAKGDADRTHSFREMIDYTFPGKRQDIRSYSALTLAYIGDVVYDLIIRTVVVGKGNRPVNDLHRLTVKYVSAPAQAKMVQALSGLLTEEERAVFQRGKNTKPHTKAKNASISDYLKATGFEAVIGYLYLTDNMERALELVKKGIALAGLEI